MVRFKKIIFLTALFSLFVFVGYKLIAPNFVRVYYDIEWIDQGDQFVLFGRAYSGVWFWGKLYRIRELGLNGVVNFSDPRSYDSERKIVRTGYFIQYAPETKGGQSETLHK